MAKTLIVIAGPTAIGKTDLSISLARHFNTEIISADSRQFYREMNIGTAKPNKSDLLKAKHHFIDSLSIQEKYTVGDFEKQAIACLGTLFINHDVVILVGGSGLFINAIVNGFDELPKAPAHIRENLNNLYAWQGIEALQEKLKVADPVYFKEVDQCNPQRLIRALEVFETSGQPFSSYRKSQAASRPFVSIKIGLSCERTVLYNRINLRVDKMIQEGLVEEAKTLIPFKQLNALNTVGYSELFDYFDGKISFEEAISYIKQNTRRFAKRQLTWFRKDEGIKWFEPNQLNQILDYIKTKTSNSL